MFHLLFLKYMKGKQDVQKSHYFCRNSSEIFATASKNDIRIWKLVTQKELLRITVPNFTCSSICFDSNGGSIISGKFKS